MIKYRKGKKYMNNNSKTVINERDLKSLPDLAPVNIENLINRITMKPVIESKEELKNQVIVKLGELKNLEKAIRLKNNQVHQIKHRASQSEEHIEAKKERDKMKEDKEKLIKEICLLERRFELKQQYLILKEKCEEIKRMCDEALKNGENITSFHENNLLNR